MAALYHGTRARLEPGGLVVPGAQVGQDHHGLGRSDVVYLTPDLHLAQHYARAARGEGVPRVVEVMPWEQPWPDDSTVNGAEQDAWCASTATVVAVVWEA